VALEAVLLDNRADLGLVVDARLGGNGGDGDNGEKRWHEEITEGTEATENGADAKHGETEATECLWPEASIRTNDFSEEKILR
jgi:hypothetical protein